jgi:hypothetical protein
MAGGRDFDPDRFELLVHHITWRTREVPNFGRVRLAKILFYVDFSHYAGEGKSLTGATYIAEKFGPFPPYLTTAEEHLVRSGALSSDRIAGKQRAEFDENHVVALKPPSVFLDGYVQALVDQWTDKIVSIPTAHQLSEQTHELPGWRLARPVVGEISYETVFIGTDEPPDRAVALGRELIGEFKWEQ